MAKATKTTLERLQASIKINDASGCWEWQLFCDKSGYGKMQVNRTKRSAHRVSYELHCGPIPQGLCVCHKCDNPCCINPKHLFVGSHADNVADKFAKGRGVTPRLMGATNPHSKLVEADVIAIRATRGMSNREIGLQYGVSKSAIGDVRSRRAWAHI